MFKSTIALETSSFQFNHSYHPFVGENANKDFVLRHNITGEVVKNGQDLN